MTYSYQDKSKLYDSVDYENILIEKSFDLIQTHLKKSPFTRIFFDEQENIINPMIYPRTVVGEEGAREIVAEFSPLLFCATYKIIDLILGWIIRKSGETPESDYDLKFDQIIKMMSSKTILLPPPLESEDSIFKIILKFYKDFRILRNAVIHKKWGENNGGDLLFDFTYENKQINVEFTLNEVLNYSKSICLTLELITMVKTSGQDELIETIKFIFDSLYKFHGIEQFNIKFPLYFEIFYTKDISVNPQNSIDLMELNNYIKILEEKPKKEGKNVFYNLFVEFKDDLKSSNWKFPSEIVKDVDYITIDSSYDKYKI